MENIVYGCALQWLKGCRIRKTSCFYFTPIVYVLKDIARLLFSHKSKTSSTRALRSSFHHELTWATPKPRSSERCPACAVGSYAKPSLITSCERAKIHVRHCSTPQGYTAWQIKSVWFSPRWLAWLMLLSSFRLCPVEKTGLMGSGFMSWVHSLSAFVYYSGLGIYIRDNGL